MRVTYTGISDGRIGDFQVFDNANQPVDAFDLNNYTITSASNAPKTDIRATITTGDLDVRRQLRWLAFPAAVQVGGLHRIHGEGADRIDRETLGLGDGSCSGQSGHGHRSGISVR